MNGVSTPVRPQKVSGMTLKTKNTRETLCYLHREVRSKEGKVIPHNAYQREARVHVNVRLIRQSYQGERGTLQS